MYNNYFYENMYRSNNDIYKNMPSLYNPTIGFNNGNMFSNLYSQYKNYKPQNLIPNNEREKLLLELSKYSFAAHELKLYLDIKPNDNSMLTLFADYTKKANELKNEYESKYGILDSNNINNIETPFAWENEIWPWEEKFNV